MLKNALQNGLLLAASLTIVLIFGEVISRVFFPDTQLRYEVDSELLAIFEPNQVGVTWLADGSLSSPVHINELGLRSASQNSLADRRILVLGDSFTFGAGVTDTETFTAGLDAALGEAISVVNAGQPGYGIFQIQVLSERLVPTIKPELVILVVWEGLLLRQPPASEEKAALLRKSTLMKKVKAASTFGTHLYRAYERLALRAGADGLVVSLGTREKTDRPIQDQYRAAFDADMPRLQAMVHDVRAAGAELMLVFWPREGFSGGSNASSMLTQRFDQLADNLSIPFVSLQTQFASRSGSELLIPNDWHPTPFAHCLVAQVLAVSLFERGYAMTPGSCRSP